jgi:hypothetical protein
MDAGRQRVPTPPEGLRPAQLGCVLLGRTVVGHVSATLVDLAQRGLLGIDSAADGTDTDWLLTDRRGTGLSGEAPADFEAALLDGLFTHQGAVRLSQVNQALIPALNRFRAQVRRDAIRHRWLRRWHPDKRTARGELLLREIYSFRWDLRALVADSNSEAPVSLAPYAIVFGLAGASAISLPDPGDGDQPPSPDRAEIPWARADRFAQGWIAACGKFTAEPGSRRPGKAPHGDFVHQWSAPQGHPDTHSTTYGTEHSGYGGDHHSGGHAGPGGAGHSGH